MKIAFWSEENQVETAFHMSLVACASAWMYPISVAAISGGYQGEELEKSLVGGRYKSNTVRNFPDNREKEELQRKKKGSRQEKGKFARNRPDRGCHTPVSGPFSGIGNEDAGGILPAAGQQDAGRILLTAGQQDTGRILLTAEQQDYFAASGLDCLLGKRREELTKQAVLANMQPVIEDKMYCLPGSRRPEQEWWHIDPLFTGLRQVLDAVEECFDVVFVDCGSRKDDFAQGVLREADICVLNMDQESELVGDYYRNPPKLRGKVFFLVGNYFEDGLYTRRNLERLYRVDGELLGAIPCHPQVKEAVRAGKTGAVARNYAKRDRAPSYTKFGQELQRAVRLILKLAGIGG